MYQVVLSKPAKKFLEKLPKPDKIRIVSAIELLPNSGDIKPLSSHPGIYRLRVGDYRIIYNIDGNQLTIYIVAIGNRGQIYKHL